VTGVLAAYLYSRKEIKYSMLAKRLQIVIVLIPVVVGLIAAGGWWFAIVVALFAGIAAWEYWRIFKHGGYTPSLMILMSGAVSLVLTRHLFEFAGSDIVLTVFLFAAVAYHVIAYEHGHLCAGCDFAITVAGMVYLGWLASYFVSLRNLPDGLWWLMTVLPASWFADSGAYLVGSHFGRHKFSPLISPKKTWEGYVGGIVISIVATALLAQLWHLRSPMVTPLRGSVLALCVSTLSPMGDLGISLIKRQFGVKDTSKLLPGHGGVLDRIDSLLWAVPIGYYVIGLLLS